MKHWLWYRADGSIGGEILLPGGHDVSHDMNDASEGAPQTVKDLRAIATEFEGFHAFAPYECACPSEDVYCDCSRQQCIGCYYDGAALVAKPTYELVLDNVVIPFVVGQGIKANNTVETVDRVPGVTSQLKVRVKGDSPEAIPDGTSIFIHCVGAEVLAVNPTELQFTSGETPTVALVAPPQGMLAVVTARPGADRRGHAQALRLRGWT